MSNGLSKESMNEEPQYDCRQELFQYLSLNVDGNTLVEVKLMDMSIVLKCEHVGYIILTAITCDRYRNHTCDLLTIYKNMSVYNSMISLVQRGRDLEIIDSLITAMSLDLIGILDMENMDIYKGIEAKTISGHIIKMKAL